MLSSSLLTRGPLRSIPLVLSGAGLPAQGAVLRGCPGQCPALGSTLFLAVQERALFRSGVDSCACVFVCVFVCVCKCVSESVRVIIYLAVTSLSGFTVY